MSGNEACLFCLDHRLGDAKNVDASLDDGTQGVHRRRNVAADHFGNVGPVCQFGSTVEVEAELERVLLKMSARFLRLINEVAEKNQDDE